MNATHSIKDADVIISIGLALFMLASTTTFHHQSLDWLGRVFGRKRHSRAGMVSFFAAIVTIHLIEVGLYAGAYVLGADVLSLGVLQGTEGHSVLTYFYFSAETFSTLGYGDVVPRGALRLVASVEALNGLLLLSWSGAFLFGALHREMRNSHATSARRQRRLS